MAQSLYPVFSIPDLDVSSAEQAKVLKAGPLFDFTTGDFVLDGQNRVVYVDGSDSYTLWVLKTLNTQYAACAAYPDYGIDAEEAMQQPDREAVQSALERTITEALSENPATERVSDFSFTWEGSDLNVRFVIKPYEWDALDINMKVVN